MIAGHFALCDINLIQINKKPVFNSRMKNNPMDFLNPPQWPGLMWRVDILQRCTTARKKEAVPKSWQPLSDSPFIIACLLNSFSRNF